MKIFFMIILSIFHLSTIHANHNFYYFFQIYLKWQCKLYNNICHKELGMTSGESGHPCLVPDFQGNSFNFSPLRIMFAVGLSNIVFIRLRYAPSITAFWRDFIINGCWILSKAFSASYEIIICLLFFFFSIC